MRRVCQAGGRRGQGEESDDHAQPGDVQQGLQVCKNNDDDPNDDDSLMIIMTLVMLTGGTRNPSEDRLWRSSGQKTNRKCSTGEVEMP